MIPKHQPLSVNEQQVSKLNVSLGAAVMLITGIFGNLSVCCVILRFPGMRSATNYYLFSLAVADLLILLLGESVSGRRR